MTELKAASESEESKRLPARHGAPWEYREFLELVNGIKCGLTTTQLAKLHQRTSGSITAAAMRLIPSADKPESYIHAVDVLANYMREKGDVDLNSLVQAICPAPVIRKCAVSARNLTLQPTPDGQQSTSGAGNLQAPNKSHELNVYTEFLADNATDADVLMLVTAAVANLPKERDRNALEMRLGVDDQPHTLAEIGEEWGVSGERVRQIQERGFKRLAARARYEGTYGSALKKLLEPASTSTDELALWLFNTVRFDFVIPLRLAAKFILRTAGFTVQKVTEVAALLPAIERSHKAQLRKQNRNRAVMERTESVITGWLNDSEWPEAIAPPPPTEQLSNQRLVNDSDIAGDFYSEKLDRMVQYESGLELEILTLLERSEQITYYQEQPAVIPYTFGGRNRYYYPDLFIATVDGRGLLIEIKPTDRMALSINRVKSNAGRAWAHARGWGWLVMSLRHTLRQVEDYQIPASIVTLLDNELKEHGVITWSDLINLRAQHGLKRFDITAYVIQSDAEFDGAYSIKPKGSCVLHWQHSEMTHCPPHARVRE
ncbi:TnsA endonuclease N-terminal domain-containing protein [Mangrovibacter phragmitis]|uniref:TnsA endonuclease N-terminal domain-containing protein n=1 Tax=Mangrovibacter phragmitis TaxID=1691903 RepID=UPI0009EE6355|nr:sigma factor-like helix-turn-helix DNA-binding protein [Mangrovibacter phragmitis]